MKVQLLIIAVCMLILMQYFLPVLIYMYIFCYAVVFQRLRPGTFIHGILLEEMSRGHRLTRGVILDDVPRNTVKGVCGGNSISHDCPGTDGCKLGKAPSWNICLFMVNRPMFNGSTWPFSE